eukprot:scaffold271903_cov27-Tisochrysis_lutea.AAC.3
MTQSSWAILVGVVRHHGGVDTYWEVGDNIDRTGGGIRASAAESIPTANGGWEQRSAPKPQATKSQEHQASN